MRITVAVCTWNRCHLLQQTLEAMTKLLIPPGVEWEVLVVNNNSTDATDAVIAGFAGRLPMRRLFEPRPGKSNALNLAVGEARGEYILWTDDDVLVHPHWAAEYCRAFHRWPDAAIFGGTIEPWFAGRKQPSWLVQVFPRVAGVYAARDLGDQPLPFSRDVTPFGANMAVRAAEQARYRYDADLGPRHDRYSTGEETAMVQRMLDAGITGWWVPNARVRHYIPEHRQSTRYVRKFFVGHGEFLARQSSPRTGPTLLGRPLWLWKQAVTSEARYRLRRVASKPDVWIEDLIDASLSWGQFRALGRPHVQT